MPATSSKSPKSSSKTANPATEFIVLAAGKGTRTFADTPKVLLPLGGKPMLFSILETLISFKNTKINLVLGHGMADIKKQTDDFFKQNKIPANRISYIKQPQQLGTGHAVATAMKKISSSPSQKSSTKSSTKLDTTKPSTEPIAMVIYGDVPLLSKATIKRMQKEASTNRAVWLSAIMDNPTGYGRILRNTFGDPIAIVEEKDCEPEQKRIKEVNTGVIAAPCSIMKKWSNTIVKQKPDNAQKEYLLTDMMKLAHTDGNLISVLRTKSQNDYLGANDLWELAQLERILQRERTRQLAMAGVYLLHPGSLNIIGDIKVGRNVSLGAYVVIKGKVVLGDNVSIGNHCVIENATIKDNTQIKDFCHVDSSIIDAGCVVGPYARLRPDTWVQAGAKIGNFVETKKSVLRKGAKVSHLTYIGDADIGENANIGAGVITCNYDGRTKHKTRIGDGAFVGSNTSLVAPVKVGNKAMIGAGSVINKDVADNSMALSRPPLKSLVGRGMQNATDTSKKTQKGGGKPSRSKASMKARLSKSK